MLGGNEKRIQALFCELALVDRSRTPQFESVWRRAEAAHAFSTVRGDRWLFSIVRGSRSLFRSVRGSGWPSLNLRTGRLALGLSLAATLVILTALLSFNWWTPKTPQRQLAADTSPNEETSPSHGTQLVAITPPKPRPHKAAHRRLIRIRPRDTVFREAAAISSWQSPTLIFMESPADSVFKSLPQLNQSVRDLESFLPDKESNQ